MKKRLIAGLLPAIMAFGMCFGTSCGGSNEDSNIIDGGGSYNETEQDEYYKSFNVEDYPVKGDVTVTAQMCGVGKEWLEELASNYKKITGINVTVKESQDATQELTTKLSIGAGLSDLYFDWSSTSEMSSWANSGYLVDLSDLNGKVAEYRNDELKPMGMYKDKTYTMPFAYNPVGFVYNQDYLDQIDSYGEYTKGQWPSTWQGLLDLCTATQNSNLKAGTTKVLPMVFGGTVKYTTYIFNGMWKSEDPEGFSAYWNYNDKTKFDKMLLNNDSTVRVMQAIRDLLDPQLQSNGKSYYPANAVTGSTGLNHTKSQTMFLNGAAVFCISGAWFQNEMIDVIDEYSSYHFGAVPVLTSGKKQSAFINVPGEHFTVPTSAKNAEGGKQFLKFILQPQNIERIVNTVQIPLAYKYDTSDVQLGTWGKEVHAALENTESAITFTDSDIMHSGALTIFGADDPIIAMSTKGITAEEALTTEANFRDKNFDYYLNLLPKD